MRKWRGLLLLHPSQARVVKSLHCKMVALACYQSYHTVAYSDPE